jgi:hypothetical protein
VPTVKRFRLKLSSILWLVAIAAAFLAGIRYWQDRAVTRAEVLYRHLVSSPAQADDFFGNSNLTTHPIKAETSP